MTTRQTRHNVRGLDIEPRDHVQGSPDAPVTLLEYGDYQCPHCGAAHPIVKLIQQEFGERLRFAFRNFPLTNIHPYAEIAAEAAEAAGAQDKFWEMHDYIFENQDALAPQFLVAAAEQLNLDVARFSDEVNRHAHAERVREDFLSGVRAGVNGTPTFFINGVRHDGSYDFETLRDAIGARLRNDIAA